LHWTVVIFLPGLLTLGLKMLISGVIGWQTA